MTYIPSAGGGAPTDATYITQTANASLSAEQALATLTTGLVKVTNGTGALSTATAGTDYAAASHTHAQGDVTNLSTDLAAKQPDIQFKDEGVNAGSSGGVTVVDFVGAGVSAAEAAGTLTVTIAGGGGVSDGDKGDIVVSGSGATWTIDTAAVTLAKMADMATDSFLGRDTAGTGVPEVLSVATTKSLLGLTGTNSGDVTLAGTPDYITISGQEITRGQIDLTTDVTGDLPYANMVQATAASKLVGRGSAAGAGDLQEISLGTGLTMSGTTLSSSASVADGDKGDITVSASGATWTIDNTAVTYAKMQDATEYSVLGRAGAASGVMAPIAAGTQSVLRRSGSGSIDFGQVEGAMIAAGVVDLTYHGGNISGNVLIGRDGLAGAPEEISLSAELQFSGSNSLRIAASGITDAMFRTAAGVSVVGRSINSAGAVADIAAGSDDHVLRRSSSVVGFGTLATGSYADGSVTYAKLQDVSATSRILGRKTAAAGDAEECTLSEVLDFVGSAAQGDILYRGAATWTRLGAGTAGDVLQSGGAGANPSWAAATGATAASQAEQETATSTTVMVTPGRQQFHPSAAKFWVKATGNSTTIVVSYNMTSWADTGVGDADGTIATDFSSAHWCGHVSIIDATLAWDATYTEGYGFDAQAAGTFGVKCGKMQDGGTAAATVEDPDSWLVMGFGDHA